MTDAKQETAEHKSSHVAGPIGAGLGLVAAIAAGFFLSEPVEDASTGRPDPDARPTGLAQPGQLGDLGGAPARPLPVPPEIVVKFRGELAQPAKDIADQFWADQEGARRRFADLAGRVAELRGLGLKRATYSGELVLEIVSVPPDADLRAVKALYRDAVEQLEHCPDVTYAEPNSTAQPGKDD